MKWKPLKTAFTSL